MEILRVLLAEAVEFLLVGGIAVATYVTDRVTGDIDAIRRRSKEISVLGLGCTTACSARTSSTGGPT